MFGDPVGTIYPAGSPLWDGLHGMRDRYEYLSAKFLYQPWFARQREDLAAIDVWLKTRSLSMYGDKEGTMYVGVSPLWDSATGQMGDRYEYLLEKFPHQPWLTKQRRMAPIDAWLKAQSLNMYGDKDGTAYTGLSPLWDPKRGQMGDRYEYLLAKFPHQPWIEKQRQMASIDNGSSARSLIRRGDALGAVYAGGRLFDETTGTRRDRYEYLVEKFPHKPWLHTTRLSTA